MDKINNQQKVNKTSGTQLGNNKAEMKISTSKILLWHTFKRTTLILNELSMAITEDAGNFAAVSCYQININCVFGQRKRESERERQKKPLASRFETEGTRSFASFFIVFHEHPNGVLPSFCTQLLYEIMFDVEVRFR